jgi:RNA 3'-phosphate cyclase
MLRLALALSALNSQPVRVENIRGARRQPGLRPQHLLAVKAAGELCAGSVTGAEIGAAVVEFHPGPLRPRPDWKLDIGTAGSITLLLQPLLPCLARAPGPSRLELTGGTNVPWSPPVDYLQHVLLPLLTRQGLKADIALAERGFYPRGGGVVRVSVSPSELRPFTVTERGDLQRIRGLAFSSGLPSHIGERMRQAALPVLKGSTPDLEIGLDLRPRGPSAGCGLCLFAEFSSGAVLGADGLGERGKRAETVGEEAARRLLDEIGSGACADSHLADQLVIWAAIAPGRSVYTAACVTDHLRLAIDVTQRLSERRFSLSGEQPVTVVCE